MLLSINNQKIKAILKKNPPTYTVAPCNLEIPDFPHHDAPSVEIHGTISVIPPDFEKARERVLALRKRIIDSGNHLLSPDEMEHEINEARGR